MGLSASKIRRIIERHPLPDKHLNDILQQWMIELAEELADNLLENVEASEKLASKEDIKQLIELSNTRFEALHKEMNTRFEAMQKEMNARFEAVNARFEAIEKRFTTLQWTIGIGFTAIFLIISLSNIFKNL